MKNTAKVLNRVLSALLAVLLLASMAPVNALSGGVQVTQTPFVQFCGAYINLGGTNYLCAVDLGAPQVDSGSDTALTAGTTVKLDLFFNINDAWYACRKQEMQGDPNEIFTVRFTKTTGGDRVTDPVWKTYPDDGYGERWYLEFTVIGGDSDAPIDLSIALTQPDVPNVGADYRITGTSAGYITCAADFVLPGYTGPCDVYFGDPVTSTGDPAAMTPGSTVCFPLMFMGGDGQLYAVYNTELQGNPADLFTVEENGTGLTQAGWKTWENGHWYLEYTVGTADTGTALGMQVRLRQADVYKATPWKSFTGTIAQKGVCMAPISIGGTVYDCTVDLQGYLTSTNDPQNMTANATICFPLMFMGGDGQWYAVLSGELQGDPSDLFTVSETITSGSALLTCTGWKTWDNGHYYLEYTVADSQYETPLELSVQLKQDAAWRQGAVDTFSGKAPPSTNPAWRQCVVPISIGGTVYDCIADLQGYLTSSGNDTLTGGGTVCFPLMFQGGDGQWYPVLSTELQGNPASLFTVSETVASGGELLTFNGWKTWENGHYYLEYTVADAEFETPVDLAVKLTQPDIGKYGDAVQFIGTVPASDDPYWKTCRVPISIGGTVYECVVDLQGYLTSSGSDTLTGGGTVAFPLMFQGGDGNWYPVLKDELQGDPAQLLTVEYTATSGGELLTFTGWGNWDSGHYFAAFTVASAKVETAVHFSAQLQQETGKAGTAAVFAGTVPAKKEETSEPDPCVVPINIGGTVYDCIVDLQGYLTSSDSDTLSGGGTVAFPLMFMGGDGVWYPVLKNELQGDPADLLTVSKSVSSGGKLLSFKGWKTWDNGHYYAEFAVASAEKDTNVRFRVQLKQSGRAGSKVTFSGTVPGSDTEAGKPTQCIAPISIDGTLYDCIVDLQGYLTSSGNETLSGGGTVAFPLMFMGGDGAWYPVLKDELQGDPAELFSPAETIVSGGVLLKCTGWKYWEGGHYYLEYAVANPEERQNVEFSVALTRNGVQGTENKFLGYAVPGPKLSEQQIPLKESASLVIERLEECADFITMSFTIADVRYDDPWPIDFESPNTTSAVITDGTIIRSDLCFMVNGQWYPVRQQECNFSIEELVTYEFEVLEGDNFLGVPRFTTRYDAYGDIWQFEVAVNSEEEGDFCFTLQLVSKDGTKTGSKYKVIGRVQNGHMTSAVEDLPPEADHTWLWIGIGAGALLLLLLLVLLVLRHKKKENQ